MEPIKTTTLLEKEGSQRVQHHEGRASQCVPARTHPGRVTMGGRHAWRCALLQDANYTTLTVTRCTITTTLSHRGPERAREADNLPGNSTEVLQKYFCCKQVFSFLWLFGEMIVSDCNHTNHCRDGCVLHANHNPNVH